jgi:hypothetical protein
MSDGSDPLVILAARAPTALGLASFGGDFAQAPHIK